MIPSADLWMTHKSRFIPLIKFAFKTLATLTVFSVQNMIFFLWKSSDSIQCHLHGVTGLLLRKVLTISGQPCISKESLFGKHWLESWFWVRTSDSSIHYLRVRQRRRRHVVLSVVLIAVSQLGYRRRRRRRGRHRASRTLPRIRNTGAEFNRTFFGLKDDLNFG